MAWALFIGFRSLLTSVLSLTSEDPVSKLGHSLNFLVDCIGGGDPVTPLQMLTLQSTLDLEQSAALPCDRVLEVRLALCFLSDAVGMYRLCLVCHQTLLQHHTFLPGWALSTGLLSSPLTDREVSWVCVFAFTGRRNVPPQHVFPSLAAAYHL